VLDPDPAGSKALGSGLVPDPTSLDPVWIRIRPDPKILDPVHPYWKLPAVDFPSQCRQLIMTKPCLCFPHCHKGTFAEKIAFSSLQIAKVRQRCCGPHLGGCQCILYVTRCLTGSSVSPSSTLTDDPRLIIPNTLKFVESECRLSSVAGETTLDRTGQIHKQSTTLHRFCCQR